MTSCNVLGNIVIAYNIYLKFCLGQRSEKTAETSGEHIKEYLPDGFRYSIHSFESNIGGKPEHFSVSMRTDVEKENIQNWIAEFSTLTGTNWISYKTRPNQKYHYSKECKCALSKHNKSKSPKNHRAHNYNCEASIKFLIKTRTVDVVKHDSLARANLLCNITINFVHSHGYGVDILSKRRVTSEVNYFYISISIKIVSSHMT